jgi:hypothetical protein
LYLIKTTIIIDYDNDSDMNRACSCYWLRLLVGITLESEAKLPLITASTSNVWRDRHRECVWLDHTMYIRASSYLGRGSRCLSIPSSIGISFTRVKEGMRGMMMHEWGAHTPYNH